jgi:hypothetical protein
MKSGTMHVEVGYKSCGKLWTAVATRLVKEITGMERAAWMLRKAIQVVEAFLCPRIDRGLVFFDK